MDKDAILDLVVQYGSYLAESGGLSQKAASSATLAEQDHWNAQAKKAQSLANWTYGRIDAALGE